MRSAIALLTGVLLLGPMHGHAQAVGVCVRTPEAAAGWTAQHEAENDNVLARSAASREVAAGGYRLRRITKDPQLHERWAWVESCAHPEWPPEMLRMPERGQNNEKEMIAPKNEKRDVAKPVAPAPTKFAASSSGHTALPGAGSDYLVRAGDRVRLWSAETNVRLEIDAVALDYGQAGKVIHCRRRGQDSLLAGVVTGPDTAELMP